MINEASLNKSKIRKLNALRKSLGNEIAEDAFSKWMKAQVSGNFIKEDPVAIKIQEMLSPLIHNKTFRLGTKGYVVRRAKGKGASGFIAQKVT
jgi:hypothetical protein